MTEPDPLRDRLLDTIPKDLLIWADEEELAAFPWTLDTWLEALGHKRLPGNVCEACGYGAPCTARMFATAYEESLLRWLDGIGALREPTTKAR